MVALGIFLLALSILISVLLHEAGHMAVAKGFGMKVTRYFVGFGSTIWSFRRGETEYGLKAIPAGGFVNIVGQVSLDDVAPEDQPRAMVTKPAYQRFLVLVAGSVTHFVIALLLFLIAFAVYPQPNGYAEVREVGACGTAHCPPAAAAGILKTGDVVTAVDGKKLTDGQNELPGIIQNSGGHPVHFTIRRNGQTLHRTVTPHKSSGTDHTWVVGIQISDARSRQSFPTAVGRSVDTFGTVVTGTFQAFGHLPANVAKVWQDQSQSQQNSKDRLVSVVGASQLGGDVFSLGGLQPLLLVIASINISFGIFNLLPLLPLDGGHIAIVAVDEVRSVFARIMRRRQPPPTDYEKLVPVTLFFAALIAIVAITALANDIIHPINLPS